MAAKKTIKKKTVKKRTFRAKKEIKEIVPQNIHIKEIMTEDKILEAFDMLGITSKIEDENTKRLFVEIARQNNLNPLKREIHAVERNQKQLDGSWKKVLTPVTGYEVFIDRAEESERLEYWNYKEDGKVGDKTYRVTVFIKRKDWPKEFHWWVRYSEACRKKKDGTPIKVWKERGAFMTMKCAISQGFRLCLREIVGKLPYIAEEIEGGQIYDKARDVNYTEPRSVNEADKLEVIADGPTLEIMQKINDLYLKMQSAPKIFSLDDRRKLNESVKLYQNNVAKLESLFSQWEKKYNDKIREASGGKES